MTASTDQEIEPRLPAGEMPGGIAPAHPAGWRERCTVFGICAFLAAIIWVVFGQTVHHAFVNFDDDTYVYENPHVQNGVTGAGLRWALTMVHASNWHPLTWVSHMLDCQFYGLNAGGHHLTNVLLHVATTLLLFLVLRRMTGFLWRSALVAAVFAIHPLRVESVAWIAERKDVMSGLFFLLTIAAYVRYVRHPWSASRYLMVALMLVLALLSKPMVVTLPFVLLLLDYWPLQRFTPAGGGLRPWRLVAEKLPLLGLCGAAGIATLFAQQQALSSLPLSARVGNALVSCGVYLQQLFYPARLAVFYPYPETGWGLGTIAAALVLVLGISWGTILAARWQPWMLVGWFWYLGMLLPAIGILQVGAQAHADRYTYLPQIGLAVMLVWTAADWAQKWRFPRLLQATLATAVILGLMIRAQDQTRCWRDSETLWTHSLSCTANNLTARVNLGNALLKRGAVEEAMGQYQLALLVQPDNPDAEVSLGYVLISEGRLDEARPHLESALNNHPHHAQAHNDMGNLLAQQGKLDAAIPHFQAALQAQPDYAEASYNLANARFQKGQWDLAVAGYQQALRSKPDYAEAGFNLGNTYCQKGDLKHAIQAYQQALQIKPDYARAAYNLGAVLLQTGDLDGALTQFQAALARKPDYAEAAFSLGNLSLQKGARAEAVRYFQRTLQINPRWAEAHYNLGVSLGPKPEALEQFQQAIELKPDYADALNNLAWALATAPDASLRNGAKAVELARRANQLAAGDDADVLDTLSAAYAEAGQFTEAQRSAAKAVALARAAGNPGQVAQLSDELQLYAAGHAYHQKAN